MKTIRYSNALWLCSNGEKILIQDMSSNHILNCIKKIKTENFRKEWLEILEYELALRRELDDLRIKLLSSGKLKKIREDSIDRHELFGRRLSHSIQFLQGLLDKRGDLVLKEVWGGYEDNDFVLEYESDESDDEFEHRIRMSLHFHRKELESKYDKACTPQEERSHLQQLMNNLKHELNKLS